MYCKVLKFVVLLHRQTVINHPEQSKTIINPLNQNDYGTKEINT